MPAVCAHGPVLALRVRVCVLALTVMWGAEVACGARTGGFCALSVCGGVKRLKHSTPTTRTHALSSSQVAAVKAVLPDYDDALVLRHIKHHYNEDTVRL